MSVFPADAVSKLMRINGILAPPRVSRNNNLYLPEELAVGDGKTIPFFLDHEDFEIGPEGPTGKILPKEPRGQIRLIWNRKLMRLEYVGQIWDPQLQQLIRSGQRAFVSLAAEPSDYEGYRGHNVPLGLRFFSAAAVDNPGIPETTLNYEAAAGKVGIQVPVFEMVSRRFVVMEAKVDSMEDVSAAEAWPPGPVVRQVPQSGPPQQAGPMQAAPNGGQTPQGPFQGRLPSGQPMPPPQGLQPQPATEPMHPDFQKVKGAMAKQYGPQQVDQVYNAWKSKNGLDDTKPYPSAELSCPHGQMLNECPECNAEEANPGATAGPVTQPAAKPWQMDPQKGGTGQTGVSGTGNLTNMVGDGTSPAPGTAWPVPDNYAKPVGTVDNTNATGGGVSREVKENRRGKRAPDMATQPLAESANKEDVNGDASSALDKTTRWPRDTTVKQVGDNTVGVEKYSKTSDKGQAGPDTEHPKVASMEEEEEELSNNSDNDSTAGQIANAKKPSAAQGGAGGKGGDEDAEAYGFSKEWLESNFQFSTLNRSTQKLLLKSLKVSTETIRIRNSGVRDDRSLAGRRESRMASEGASPRVAGMDSDVLARYGIEYHLSNLEDHIAVIEGKSVFAHTNVPFFNVPDPFANDYSERKKFQHALESYNKRYSGFSRFAIETGYTTGTSGAALGTEEMAPALVVPSNLAGLARDTYLVQVLAQGRKQALFQTIAAWTMGGLTENTAPSQVTPTLTAPNVTTSERGGLLQISFKLERQGIGPHLEGQILAARLGELYDEDYLAFGAGQAFETASIPTSGGQYNTGNIVYGTGVSAENLVTSAMVMNGQVLADVQTSYTTQGYSADNVVGFVQPHQFGSLLKDTTYLNRFISFGPNTDSTRSMQATGVIPEIDGIEIRKSTLGVNRASGSNAGTTYHAWFYKKGLTAALAISRDIQVETFRDVEARSIWLSVHYDMGVGVLHPNSLVEAVTQ